MGKRTVLLIDDDRMVRGALGILLHRYVPEVDATIMESAKVALMLLRRGVRWDVILCDWYMAEMNGRQFCEALATFAPELAAGVVILTGGLTNAEDERWIASHRVLHKPATMSELREVLGLGPDSG